MDFTYIFRVLNKLAKAGVLNICVEGLHGLLRCELLPGLEN